MLDKGGFSIKKEIILNMTTLENYDLTDFEYLNKIKAWEYPERTYERDMYDQLIESILYEKYILEN